MQTLVSHLFLLTRFHFLWCLDKTLIWSYIDIWFGRHHNFLVMRPLFLLLHLVLYAQSYRQGDKLLIYVSLMVWWSFPFKFNNSCLFPPGITFMILILYRASSILESGDHHGTCRVVFVSFSVSVNGKCSVQNLKIVFCCDQFSFWLLSDLTAVPPSWNLLLVWDMKLWSTGTSY